MRPKSQAGIEGIISVALLAAMALLFVFSAQNASKNFEEGFEAQRDEATIEGCALISDSAFSNSVLIEQHTECGINERGEFYVERGNSAQIKPFSNNALPGIGEKNGGIIIEISDHYK